MNEQRKEFILDQLRLNRKVKASTIVKEFNVSMETVRRDLEELEKQGLLRKVYGGATVGRIYEAEKPYNDRQVIRLKEKQAIAKATVDLLEDNDTLFLDGGSTLLEIAKEIHRRNLKITVVTGTIPIAQVINKSDNATVIMLGGVLTKDEEISSGVLCEEYLKIFHTHKAIIGVASITESNGVTDYDMQMTIIKRKMIDRSDTSIFVADHSKFNKSVVYTVAELDEVDVLVTDSKTDPKDIEMCRKHDINVIIADV